MAQTSWPFENVDTSETQFSQWARNIGEGVKGSSAGTELKVTAATGLNLSVAAGQSMVRGHYYISTASENLVCSAANASNPRIDSVVLELDPAENAILLKVVTGTPASSPVAPTLSQTDAGIYQQLLATVLVPAAATAVSTITDSRVFLGVAAHTQNANTIVTSTTGKSANYTLVSSDRNTFIRSSGSAITITVPDVLTNGESVNFVQGGSGQITFAGSGLTINSADGLLKTSKQYAGVTLGKVDGFYYLIGALA